MKGNLANGSVSIELPPVGIAIFGLGRIGTIHLNNLRRNPRAKILYGVDESEERINFLKNNLKIAESEITLIKTSEQKEVFQDKNVDAVLVCTSTFAHEEIILKSLEAGKVVFCEKPLAVSREGIERCIAAAKKYSKPLHCGYNRRFDPGARSLKHRIDSGEIGDVHILKSCSRDYPRSPTEYFKTSGGIFHDCGIHDLDYICWALNEYPESVTVVAHANYEDIREIGDYDTVVITLKFPSGKISVTDLSRYAAYGYDLRIEALGSKGMITCGDLKPVGIQVHNEKGSTTIPLHTSCFARYQESYVQEMEHFLNVVQGLEECEVKLESILVASDIATACKEAAITGKTVPLSWKF